MHIKLQQASTAIQILWAGVASGSGVGERDGGRWEGVEMKNRIGGFRDFSGIGTTPQCSTTVLLSIKFSSHLSPLSSPLNV